MVSDDAHAVSDNDFVHIAFATRNDDCWTPYFSVTSPIEIQTHAFPLIKTHWQIQLWCVSILRHKFSFQVNIWQIIIYIWGNVILRKLASFINFDFHIFMFKYITFCFPNFEMVEKIKKDIDRQLLVWKQFNFNKIYWKFFFLILHGKTQIYNFCWIPFQFREKHVLLRIFHSEILKFGWTIW